MDSEKINIKGGQSQGAALTQISSEVSGRHRDTRVPPALPCPAPSAERAGVPPTPGSGLPNLIH